MYMMETFPRFTYAKEETLFSVFFTCKKEYFWEYGTENIFSCISIFSHVQHETLNLMYFETCKSRKIPTRILTR